MPHPPFIALDETSQTPLHRQIYDAIRTSILAGEFQSGRQLLASRRLSDRLRVSRMTVVNAYEQLLAEGYVESRAGAGTFVARQLPEEFLQVDEFQTRKKRESVTVSRDLSLSGYGETVYADCRAIMQYNRATPAVPFQYGVPAIDHFPFRVWTKLVDKCYYKLKRDSFGYGDPAGFRPLREAIAAYLKSFRAVNCTPEQVIITSGAQDAFDLIARVLLNPKTVVWVENPCYLSAKQIFASAGAKLVGVPVDENGLDLSAAPRSGRKPRLVYITPSHQFPLGVTMSLSRRLQLLEWAKKTQAYLLEDDYDSEFRYEDRPIPSLQGLDRDGRVLYIGTFSKTIFSALRLGCIVAPPDLAEVLTAVRALNGSHSPIIEQATLAEFINEGHLTRHIRRMRRLYSDRQDFLIAEIKKQLAGKLEVKRTGSGMHLIGWLPAAVNDEMVVRKAAEQGVKLVSVSSHSLTNWRRGGLVLGFTATNEEQMRQGVRKLARVLAQTDGR